MNSKLVLLLLAVLLLVVAPIALHAQEEEEKASSDMEELNTLERKAKTAKPTKAKKTAKPTKVKPSKLTTSFPTRKETSSPVPSTAPSTIGERGEPSTLKPTTTRRPTFPLGQAKCDELATSEQCSERGHECEWYTMNTCNRLVDPMVCRTFEYGCQERKQFCKFSKGNEIERMMQCNYKAFPCKWNYKTLNCDFVTRAPSIHYTELP